MTIPVPHLLVVEDDPGIAEHLEMALSELGYAVTLASTSAQCWASLAAASAPPELILLDFLLSGEDGLDLCRALKRSPEYRRITVVVMSAHPDGRRRAPEAGADDFLPKPFDLDELEAVVSRHVPVRR